MWDKLPFNRANDSLHTIVHLPPWKLPVWIHRQASNSNTSISMLHTDEPQQGWTDVCGSPSRMAIVAKNDSGS